MFAHLCLLVGLCGIGVFRHQCHVALAYPGGSFFACHVCHSLSHYACSFAALLIVLCHAGQEAMCSHRGCIAAGYLRLPPGVPAVVPVPWVVPFRRPECAGISPYLHYPCKSYLT